MNVTTAAELEGLSLISLNTMSLTSLHKLTYPPCRLHAKTGCVYLLAESGYLDITGSTNV